MQVLLNICAKLHLTTRHKNLPDGFLQGNTTVIIGNREVLVVDSCYLPSTAKEDIAQIKQ